MFLPRSTPHQGFAVALYCWHCPHGSPASETTPSTDRLGSEPQQPAPESLTGALVRSRGSNGLASPHTSQSPLLPQPDMRPTYLAFLIEPKPFHTSGAFMAPPLMVSVVPALVTLTFDGVS